MLKNFKISELVIGGIGLLYIIGFGVLNVVRGNHEFLLYEFVMLALFLLIIGTLHKTRFTKLILAGLLVWGFLHLAGGGVVVDGAVLYAYVLLPIYENGELVLLKYDQVVHAFGFAVSTLVAFHLLAPHIRREYLWRAGLTSAILIGMGLGVVNEIVEFIATVALPETNVGGYHNTMLDLIFNTLGSLISAFFIYVFYKKGYE